MGLLVVFGLVGGWLLAGVVLRPLDRITDAAAELETAPRPPSRSARPQRRAHRPRRHASMRCSTGWSARSTKSDDSRRTRRTNCAPRTRSSGRWSRSRRRTPAGRDVDAVLDRIGVTNDRAIASTEALLDVGAHRARSRTESWPRWISRRSSSRMPSTTCVRMPQRRGIRIETSLAPTVVSGDRVLLAQLTANLVGNAVVHNIDGGWVKVVAVFAVPTGGRKQWRLCSPPTARRL